MGQMLAGAAHELNNPLTAILGVSDLLTEGDHDELTKRQAGLILKQARRAADIVQNLLAFSRPRASGLLPLRIEDVIHHIVHAQRAEFEKKRITVTVEAAPGMPPVEADRKLLTQVFSNIVVNAEQAISAAKPAGTIAVAIKSAGDRVCITFENDGPPIPAEILGKLFDPFFTTQASRWRQRPRSDDLPRHRERSRRQYRGRVAAVRWRSVSRLSAGREQLCV